MSGVQLIISRRNKMNLIESIVKERDRLIRLKEMLGQDIELPNFFFYKAQLNAELYALGLDDYI